MARKKMCTTERHSWIWAFIEEYACDDCNVITESWVECANCGTVADDAQEKAFFEKYKEDDSNMPSYCVDNSGALY